MSTTAPEQVTPQPIGEASLRTRSDGVVQVVLGAVLLLALVVGGTLRAWYLVHQPTTSDEATAGLMANQILHGHFSAFYWGQAYGGVEPYIVAAFFAVFGHGAVVLTSSTVALTAVSALLTWRLARRLVDDAWIAMLAGALFWVASQVALLNSTIEFGFRGVTLACGLGAILFSLRVLDGRQSPQEFIGLGLLVGIGWWASPEIVYFLIPTGLLLVGSIVSGIRSGHGKGWFWRTGVTLVAAGVGALPWLWVNLNSRFDSLNHSAFMVPPGAAGFGGRVKLFFQLSFPMLVNLRVPDSTRWIHGAEENVVLLALFLAALVLSMALIVARRGRGIAIVVAALLFPFVLAISPATWFQGDGRYVGYAVPLLVLTFAMGLQEGAHRLAGRVAKRRSITRTVARLAMAGTVVISALLTIGNFSSFRQFVDPVQSFGSGWGNPNGPTQTSIRLLEAGGVHYGYADYWVAYKIDYLSNDSLSITDVAPEVDRWASLNAHVHRATVQSWLFVTPTIEAQRQFSSGLGIQGPDGLSEAAFLTSLTRLGVSYRLITAGLVQAVVPSRSVTPSEVGVP